MIGSLLSWLFPPRLPSRATGWVTLTTSPDEQGWCGNVRRKTYRNGIERHFAERQQPRYFATNSQYMTQLRNAEQEMARDILEMEARGFRLVQDEWIAPLTGD